MNLLDAANRRLWERLKEEHQFTGGYTIVKDYKHLLLCHIEQRPPRLDMENYPHLPLAQVRTTQAVDYMSLLATPSNTGASA
jgi:hypothetical protein